MVLAWRWTLLTRSSECASRVTHWKRPGDLAQPITVATIMRFRPEWAAVTKTDVYHYDYRPSEPDP